MPKAFIPTITGAQSRAIAEAMKSSGWDVEGSSRSAGTSPQPMPLNADVLVLTIPQDHRPGAMTGFVDAWVDAAMQGSVGRIVLNIGGTPGPADEHPFFADLHTARDRVSRSGLPYVILQPTVYFDNLAAPWAADALAAGTIAYPADPAATVSWLSHRTLGSWVVAVADGAQDGRVVPIGGPQALTGPELAAEIGAALGRPLTYVSVPPSAFGEGLNAVMGAPAGDRLASIYARLSQHLRSMEVDPSDAISLGVELETARQFASRVLA